MMRRRQLMRYALAAAVGWPVAARSQQPVRVPVVGYLSSSTPSASAASLSLWRDGLAETGFVEGRNVVVEYRWAEDDYGRLPALAAELFDRQVDVIVARGILAALEAKAATTKIPIVFSVGVDPVAFGLVKSINRPGSNLTGVMWLFSPLLGKRLQLLHELVPEARTIGFLVNPRNRNVTSQKEHFAGAAQALGLDVAVLTAGTADELEAAFLACSERGIRALLVGNDPFYVAQRDRIVAAAGRYVVPTAYHTRDFVTAGGLTSYGPNLADTYSKTGFHVGRILNGAKPAELPIEQPTRFELVINLTTAKALGLTVPPILLVQAEVIE